jgi:hypothetical protein
MPCYELVAARYETGKNALKLSFHIRNTLSTLRGTRKAVKVTRPSTSAVTVGVTCSKMRKCDVSGADDDKLSVKVRFRSVQPDSTEACESSESSCSGRFCRNSAQAGEDWKFFTASRLAHSA